MKRVKAILSAFDGSDIPVIVLVLGLILVAYGASQLKHGLGSLVCGVLLILYARPVSRWLR